jgi:hypothetical protein
MGDENPPLPVSPQAKVFPAFLTSVRVWIGVLLLIAALDKFHDALFVSPEEKERDLQDSAQDVARYDDAEAHTEFYRNYDRTNDSTGEALATGAVFIFAGAGLVRWGSRAAKRKAAKKMKENHENCV